MAAQLWDHQRPGQTSPLLIIQTSLVFHYASDVGKLSPSLTKDLHISVAETILNKESGWKALTGTTNFGTIANANAFSSDAQQQEKNKLAFDLLVDRICGFVGSYYVSLKGQVDALVFAGGIGEKSDALRKAVVEQCACLGFEVDEERNQTTDEEEMRKVVRDISSKRQQGEGSGREHRVLICQTDEQYEMAHAAAADTALWQHADGTSDDGKTPELSMMKAQSNDVHG